MCVMHAWHGSLKTNGRLACRGDHLRSHHCLHCHTHAFPVVLPGVGTTCQPSANGQASVETAWIWGGWNLLSNASIMTLHPNPPTPQTHTGCMVPSSAATARNAAAVHYHILGAGAMGCLFAASLARKGGEGRVSLLTRGRSTPTTTATIHVQETYATAPSSSSSSFSAQVPLEPNDGAATAPITRLLVLTKAYDALPALSSLAPRLRKESVVVLLSNGMGLFEEIHAAFAAKEWVQPRWVLGTTTHGALLKEGRGGGGEALTVAHTGMGETFLGLPFPTSISLSSTPPEAESEAALQAVLSELAPAGLGVVGESPPNMNRRLWLKLAVNACINPLTGLLHCRNRRITSDKELETLITSLCAETAAVAAAVSSSSPASSSTHLPSAAELEAYVHQIATTTGKNESSMYRDLQGRRRTEIDYLNGYLVREGKRLGIDVPRHEVLTQLIKAKEAVDSV